jgi:uncharacterized phage-associated protein
MPAAVKSAFEIAFWFADAALKHNEYLQPQKLQRLLFLAQAYFAVAYSGKQLMPAVFVADDAGPLEPNIYMSFSRGRPRIDVDPRLPAQVEMFLDSVWRRFGHHSADHLTRMTVETAAYRTARKQGPRAEISLEAMRRSFERPTSAPGVQDVMRPKVMRSHTGRPVAVRAWLPGVKQTVEPGKR